MSDGLNDEQRQLIVNLATAVGEAHQRIMFLEAAMGELIKMIAPRDARPDAMARIRAAIGFDRFEDDLDYKEVGRQAYHSIERTALSDR